MKNDSFNYVSRVTAVKTFRGIDGSGFNSLVFIFREKPNFELTTSKINSRVLELSNEYRLFISLVVDDSISSEIFEILSEDLISSIEKAVSEVEVQEILSIRFQYWSDLFKRKYEKLDEKWIQGYIGELWYLSEVLIQKIGITDAIKSWTGPDKANQDFITRDKVFEIKTRNKNSYTIRISNDNQLNEDMYLVVIDTEKSSPIYKNSYSLSNLINKIYSKIDSPKLSIYFNQKLLELGLYPIDEANQYDKFAYVIKKYSYYLIGRDFPIVAHSDIPEAIVRYQYDLLVDGIEKFYVCEEEVWN